MTNLAVYLLLFIIPIFILIFIIVKLLLNNFKMVETRLLSIALINFCFVLLGGFLRHTLPLKYVPFFSSVVMGICILISLSTLLHLIYILLVKYCHLQGRLVIVLLCYIPVLFQCLALFLGFGLSVEEFDMQGIWVYPKTAFHNIWIFSMISTNIVIAIMLSAFGVARAKSAHGKSLFHFFLITHSLFLIIFALMFSFLLNPYFPSISIILFMAIASIIFIVGITKFELIPSLESRYQTMFEVTPAAIVLLSSELEVLEYNIHARKTFHASTNRSLAKLLHTIHNQEQAILLIQALQSARQLSNFILDFEQPLTSQKITLAFEAAIIPFGSDEYYYIMWRDITDETEKESLAQHLAYHDALTGLHNRAYFVQHVERYINQSLPTDIHAVVLVDLNYFKQINDNHGHAVGDLVLQHMASILQSIVKSPHITARLGGDEFVLFLQNLKNKEEIEAIVATIRQRCQTDIFRFQSVQLTISPSIGYSVYMVDGNTLEQLLHVSDVNMYRNKAAIKQQQAPTIEKN
ncbi:GGDEF domain-containing protein [Metasolibacillus meyeri]|uniref:GGDEF domain-containing protein n=1 Tax=Metasolibacillus meyeri TaxID=1071052 RepID=A0AAW9NWJ1_9BACL|nr:GGDEF domain-containing protein [Metasolibacillus meyeri]MEC1179701.1 GGDEF domain-containing protein [Metasolibacillus meyeri]